MRKKDPAQIVSVRLPKKLIQRLDEFLEGSEVRQTRTQFLEMALVAALEFGKKSRINKHG